MHSEDNSAVGVGLKLETERLTLQKPHRKDLPVLAREIGKAQVARYLATVPHPYTFIDATSWFGTINAGWAVNSFTFGIYEKQTPQDFLGVISLEGILARHSPCPSLGYWLAATHWGRGIMSEAVGAMLAFAFERLNAPAVEATYLEENPASGRVMEKNGFSPVKQTLLWSRFNGAYLPGTLMSCNKTSWMQEKEK